MTPEKRILVVDDDGPIRALLSTVLRRRGFSVDTARDGEHALTRLAECRYALLILDLMMPRVSGYDVVEHVASMPAGTRPLILLLTAGLEPKPLDPSLVLGTMHKPFDVEILVDAVSAAIGAFPGQRQRDDCPPADELPRDPSLPN